MNYKAISTRYLNQILTPKEVVFRNRGIKDVKKYLSTTDEVVNSPEAFGKDILNAAASALVSTINNNKKMIVVVDSDVDGWTSAALLLNYLYDLFPSYITNSSSYFMHEGKQHGLNDCYLSILDSDVHLVVLPDSSSNDYSYHKMLKDNGKQIIILDHHEAKKISDDAIVINNQLSNYPNKFLSGVGVVWQFCRYLDKLLGVEHANSYIDLVALGLIGDMMSLTSFETKHLIQKGLEPDNIKNPFIYEMWQSNYFKLGEHMTPMGEAFYIAPFINAMVRSGTKEEKIVLFESLLKYRAFEKVPSTKRGHKIGEVEQVVTQGVRNSKNVKNRQTKAQEAGLLLLEKKIKEQDLMKHKILLFLLEPNEIDRNIAGLVANQIMSKYQRPCCILTKVRNPDSNEFSYQGSARGYDKSGITNFKDICASISSVIFAEGHQGAFGLGISANDTKDIEEFLEQTDKKLASMSSEPLYLADFIWNEVQVSPSTILDIAELNTYWGKDMDEPLIVVEDLNIFSEMVTIYRKKTNTLKISANGGQYEIIKFNLTDEEVSLFEKTNFSMTFVAYCRSNDFCGKVTPQLEIVDYEVTEKTKMKNSYWINRY